MQQFEESLAAEQVSSFLFFSLVFYTSIKTSSILADVLKETLVLPEGSNVCYHPSNAKTQFKVLFKSLGSV